jgi:hypothetical protein
MTSAEFVYNIGFPQSVGSKVMSSLFDRLYTIPLLDPILIEAETRTSEAIFPGKCHPIAKDRTRCTHGVEFGPISSLPKRFLELAPVSVHYAPHRS